MTILNSNASAVYDFGPGGDIDRPQMSRHIKIFNDRPGQRLFVPDRTAAERNSVYRNANKITNVNAYQGQYTVGDRLYRNTAAIGTGPCWTLEVGGEFNTPAAAPAGFIDDGVKQANGVNPNAHKGSATVRSGAGAQDVSWQAFQVWGWGCSDNSTAKVAVRHCYI